MAKEKSESEATSAPKAVPPTSVAQTGGADGRSIILTMENGEKIKRVDYIRQRWADKVSRGQIAKEVTALQVAQGGKECPYQVVFQATKDLSGGPDKIAKTSEEASE